MKAFILVSCLALAAARPEAGYSYNRPGGHGGGGFAGGSSIGSSIGLGGGVWNFHVLISLKKIKVIKF